MARAHQQEQEVWVCSDDRYHHHPHHAPLVDDGPPPPLGPGGGAPRREVAGGAEEHSGVATGAVEEADEEATVTVKLTIGCRSEESKR